MALLRKANEIHKEYNRRKNDEPDPARVEDERAAAVHAAGFTGFPMLPGIMEDTYCNPTQMDKWQDEMNRKGQGLLFLSCERQGVPAAGSAGDVSGGSLGGSNGGAPATSRSSATTAGVTMTSSVPVHHGSTMHARTTDAPADGATHAFRGTTVGPSGSEHQQAQAV